MKVCRRGVLACVVVGAVLGGRAWAEEARVVQADVCVVGGGSAGVGAAIAASRAGADVVLVERQDRLGGTSVQAYVSAWEPGVAGPLAREIYDRLAEVPGAVGFVRDHNRDRSQGPFGLWLVTPGLKYEQTLRRAGVPRAQWRAMVFEPEIFPKVVARMLAETGRCRTLLETTFTEAETDGRRVRSIRAKSADGTVYRVRARVYIDCTGGGHLCRAAGCETMLGAESAEQFGEPSAPPQPELVLNAISLCYRVRPSDHPKRQPAPDPPVARCPRSAHVSGLPCGDLLLNPLAMLPGRALVDKGYDACMAEAKRIVQAHWHTFQAKPAFASYEFHSYAPMLGIRESYRVVGEYVLTQHDLMAGLSGQSHADIVALADHSMDVHGRGSRRVRGELDEPYGIPYRCLVVRGWTNLLVAGRCASFSHIAASSCRLSRTMLALGRAAGAGAAQAARSGVPVGEIDVPALQEELGVALDAPE